jgi:acetyl-CoA carboxylase carboxyl transferase subunit beta
MNMRLGWRERLAITADPGTFTEFDAEIESANPIGYPGYAEKIAALQQETGTREAAVTGRCMIGGEETLIGIMDSRFMMASMGSAAGEKIARLFEYGAARALPVILFTASGGARMQEGTVSLMQMAKTAGAAALHSRAGRLYIAVLCDPTTGGVQASFASLGDIIIAEQGAAVGFAGKRVIAGALGSSLPGHFQTAEFLLEHGFADAVCERGAIRPLLSRLLRFHRAGAASPPGATADGGNTGGVTGACRQDPLGAGEKLDRLRSLNRPGPLDYLSRLFTDFTALRGDRCYGDDPALAAGIAFFEQTPVTIIATPRGTDIEGLKRTNFSMPHPEGYRKALRLARQAEKFRRPVVCLIDTPGAFCGVEAEERGQGQAIAANLAAFMELRVPVVSVIVGEGGSGGALALAVCDELAMMENALYSVINPRGFAAILWKDPSREKEAAELMKTGARDLRERGICDMIIGEEGGLEHSAENLRRYLSAALSRLSRQDYSLLPALRYRRFRAAGEFIE